MQDNTNHDKPFISIIMPVYNNAKLLSNAVQSVFNQSFENWELIIIDDGSTDDTPAVADAFAVCDRRIRVIHQENQWIYKSINNGYAAALGEYALVVNSDDTINPDALKEIYKVAVIDRADLVVFNLWYRGCNGNQEVIDPDLNGCRKWLEEPFSLSDCEEIHKIWPKLVEKSLVNHQCVYRKSIYKVYTYPNQYYADDILYNQIIADDVHVIAGTPYCVYNSYFYSARKMNASIGKYYGYEHNMFNAIYLGNMRLFEKWGVLNIEAENIITAIRLRGLTNEIHSYSSYQCSLTMEEKVKKIIEGATDPIVYNSALDTGKLSEWERRIISGLWDVLDGQRLDRNSKYYFIQELLDGIYNFDKGKEGKEKIRSAVFHRNNQYHIGIWFMNKFGVEKL